MSTGDLGHVFAPGHVIIRQGEPGDCMYVIQEGKVEIYLEQAGQEVSLTLCREGDFLGEVALFTRQPHSASARALTAARLLTITRQSFMRRVQEDPSLAFRLAQALCQRVAELGSEVAALNRMVQAGLDEHLRQKNEPLEWT